MKRISVCCILAALTSALVAPGHAGAQLTARVLRGPYLQVGTPTSLVVRWRTDVPTDSRVRYGPNPGDLGSEAYDPTLTTEHEVALSGLTPSTRYYYSIGSSLETLAGGDAGHTFVTAPPAGAAEPFRIWAFGDSGLNNLPQIQVRDAYLTFAGGRRADVWLMLGDNAYVLANDLDYQTDLFMIYPMVLRQTVVWPTFGNHEALSANAESQTGDYFSIFTLPAAGQAGGAPSGTEAYYSFDYANVHFVCLNSEMLDLSPSGAMLTWLRADLAANAQDWTIVFFHRPPYSKGSHDSDIEGPMIAMRENALPILEQAGVDLVLTGHSHSYERSYLIDGHYGSSATFDPAVMRLDDGDGAPEGDGPYRKPGDVDHPHAGTVYAVVGTGESNSGGPLDHPAKFRSIGDHAGTLVIDVSGRRLDALFLDEQGGIQDRFTLIKGGAAAP